MKKTGVLIVNLGTPDSPSRKDVKTYLTEFLMDERVIDIPAWRRTLLVKGIIAPFRSMKVAKEYKKLWMDEGSPLLVHGKELAAKVQGLFNRERNSVYVELAMRYQSPSIKKALERLNKINVHQIIVFPLFPQYASATTGSVAQKVMEIVSKWNAIPDIDFIQSYHEDAGFIEAFASKVSADIEKYQPDHVLFSYHGIPERHLTNLQEQNEKQCAWPKCGCEKKALNKPYCYRSACFKTSERIAETSKIGLTNFTTSFQSRLGKSPWIKPYTDEMIKQLLKRGVKNLLVVSPSFTADCLETSLEIGEEYRELFMENGGEAFHFTESLNAEDQWSKAVFELIKRKINKHENKNYNSPYSFKHNTGTVTV